MGQINTNNYPTVNSLADADLLIVENAQNGTGTTTPKQLRENAIGTDPLQTASQSVTGAINELKNEIDAGAGVVRYDVDAITDGYLGQFSGSADLLLLHLTTDGTADANNGYMMMLSYSRPVARFAYGRLVDTGGAAYKHDVYADNTIICIISNNGTGTESDPKQVVILGIMNAGFTLTPAAVVSDRDIIDGQGNTLSVLAEALTKTASGNPVVISDCAGGKARSLKTAINAIQDLHGLPFPYVGGAYKNKFDITEISDVANSYKTKEFTLKANVTYTISTDLPKNNNNSANLFFYLPSASPDTSVNGVWSEQTRTLTTGADGKFIIGYRTTDYTDPSAEWYLSHKIQIEEGSTATSYAPYSNICPISGRTEAVVLDDGANLIDETALIAAVLDPSTGQPSPSSEVEITPMIAVESSSTYLFAHQNGNTFRIFAYAADGTFIERTDTYAGDAVVTTGATWKFIRIQGANSAWISTDPIFSQRTTATIQLGQTVYGADINWDTGVGTVLDAIADMGDLTWTYNGTSQVFNSSVLPGATTENVYTDAISSSYKEHQTGMSAMVNGDFRVLDGVMTVKDTAYTDATAFKTAVTGQTVCYKLATPQTIQLTPTQLQMLKGYNRVTIDNGSIELGYIAKIA